MSQAKVKRNKKKQYGDRLREEKKLEKETDLINQYALSEHYVVLKNRSRKK